MSLIQKIAKVASDPRVGGRGGVKGALVIYTGGSVPVLLIKTDAAVDTAWVDVTSGLPTGSVSYSEIQNVSATDRLLGRDTAGAGVIEELTVGGGLSFTGAGGIQITDAGVTLAKQANLANATVIGRNTAGTGVPEAVTMSQLAAMLAASSGITTTYVKVAGGQTFTSTALADATGMLFPVVAGSIYRFRMSILVQSTLQTVGVSHTLTYPAMTRQGIKSDVHILTTDAPNGRWMGAISASADAVVPTSAQAANEDSLLTIEGFIIPSASGNVQLQLARETDTGGATITFEYGLIVVDKYL